MASKNRNRRLSLPRNWRIKKNTRNNGEVFYMVQWRTWFGAWIDENDGDEFVGDNSIEDAKDYVAKSIASRAAKYDKACGKKIAKREIIKIG